MHVPIMVEEVLARLRPQPGEVAVDCTLGGGGHARAILKRLRPTGRLVGLDVDSRELAHTEAALRADGYGPELLSARHETFARLPQVLIAEGLTSVDIVLADLGVSSMQVDNPSRGFSYKGVGPLDMRMDPTHTEPASALLARLTEQELAHLLDQNADEPRAECIAGLLKRAPLLTTHAAERAVRVGLTEAFPRLTKPEVKNALRRTFQALRIAVNDEFSALDAFLRSLPSCLSPGGRVAVISFHSGEDRRVKKAFQAGHRAGVFAEIASEVIRPSMAETRANRRASSAKLRWAITPAHQRPGAGGTCASAAHARADPFVGDGHSRNNSARPSST